MSRLNLGEISRSFDLMGRCEDAFLVFIDKKIFTFWRSVLHVDYLNYYTLDIKLELWNEL